MRVEQEKINDLQAHVIITLAKDDYESKVAAEIKKIAKKADIKGFRPGTVPAGVVKKMYGNAVLAETINKELNEQMWSYLQENKINVLGQPIPATDQPLLDIDINSMSEVHFKYEIGLAPEVNTSEFSRLPALTQYKITIPEKMIDDEIGRITRKYATYEYPDTVHREDILSLTIEELNQDGSIKENGISTVASVMVNLLKPEHEGDFLTMKKHESVEKNVWDIMDRERDAIAKNILNINDPAVLAVAGDKYKMTLNNITRSKPAVLNEELFDKVYGTEDIKTEEAMRAHIAKDLEAYFDGQSDAYLVNDVYRSIIANMHMTLPEDFLKRWLKIANEKEITLEQIEKDFPQFAKQLKWDLITKKVVQENELQNTAEEITERIKMDTIRQLISYGINDIESDWVQQMIHKQTADKKTRSETSEQLLMDKVMQVVKTKISVLPTPISLDDFKALIEQDNKEAAALQEAQA